MPGQFLSPDGDLESAFVSDPAIIDQFAKTGSLWSWGSADQGQLGDGASFFGGSKSSPVQTSLAGTGWASCSGGMYVAGAIKTDGTLWTMGYNYYGSLGDGTSVDKNTPVQISGTNWKQVSTSISSAAIKTDGTLWTWGQNAIYSPPPGGGGLLGDGTEISKSSPVQIAGTTWKQVSSGRHTKAAIKTDGTLWMWGYNNFGQLADGTTTGKSSPIQIPGTTWKMVNNSWYHVAAIKTDGTLWTWGFNSNYQLGIGTQGIHKSSPVQTLAGGTNWKMVACGKYHSAAIKTDGTLWTWGYGYYGTLGDNTTTDKTSPVQIGGTNWKVVAAGGYISAAIKTDGTLWTWGRNQQGFLGDGTTTNRSSPVQTLAGGNNWKTLSVGDNFASAIYFYDAGNLYPG